MKIWRELLGYVKLIVIVVAITLVINNVVLINAKIPSPSMEKTLMVKDRLFGFRLAYGINLNLFGYEIRFDCYHCDLFAVAALDDYRFGINLILYIRGKSLVEISGHTVIQRRGDVTFKKRTLKHNIFLFFCPLRRSVPPQRSEIAVISVYALPKNLSMFTTFSFSAA